MWNIEAMNEYQNGKVYLVRSYLTADVYVGSTKETLNRRMSGHRNDYKRFSNGKSKNYCAAYEILKFGDAYIELYENYPCGSKEELRKREGEVQRSMFCVNKVIAGRTKAEKDAAYRAANKEKIYQSHAQRIECTKCGSIVRRNDMARHQKTLKCKVASTCLIIDMSDEV